MNFFAAFTLLAFNYWVEIKSVEILTTVPTEVNDAIKGVNVSELKEALKNTRRIIAGNEVLLTRPYMVYLKLPANNPKYQNYRRWLCGGVIVHEEYILTSAACIEDTKYFYVVSGTYMHDPDDDKYNNLCIKNGAKKAIWKCIPRNYVFDGHENDNIRWMNNDIAIVKVEDEFDFVRRIKGCEFTPKPICFNNQTQKFEDPGTFATIAGWGSTERYNEWINTRRGANSSRKSGTRRESEHKQQLLEAPAEIINKNKCKVRWGPRYQNIIDNYMICTKDLVPELSELCSEKYVDCHDIDYELDDGESGRRATYNSTGNYTMHSAYHNHTEGSRRAVLLTSGGFCENDHGGPLIIGEGQNSIVIGVISACLVKERTNRCYGPFLYTSVYKNRNLIACAIYKDKTRDCNKLFRASETHEEVEISWTDHPDGPARNEVKRREMELNKTSDLIFDDETKYEPETDQSNKNISIQTDKETKKT